MDFPQYLEFLKHVEKARQNEIQSTMAAINELNRSHMEFFLKYKAVFEQRGGSMGSKDFVDGYSLSGVEDDASTPQPPEDGVSGNTREDKHLKNMENLSKIITNRLKTHVEHTKQMHEMIMDTHRKSFELFREMDQYLESKKNKGGQ